MISNLIINLLWSKLSFTKASIALKTKSVWMIAAMALVVSTVGLMSRAIASGDQDTRVITDAEMFCLPTADDGQCSCHISLLLGGETDLFTLCLIYVFQDYNQCILDYQHTGAE